MSSYLSISNNSCTTLKRARNCLIELGTKLKSTKKKKKTNIKRSPKNQNQYIVLTQMSLWSSKSEIRCWKSKRQGVIRRNRNPTVENELCEKQKKILKNLLLEIYLCLQMLDFAGFVFYFGFGFFFSLVASFFCWLEESYQRNATHVRIEVNWEEDSKKEKRWRSEWCAFCTLNNEGRKEAVSCVLLTLRTRTDRMTEWTPIVAPIASFYYFPYCFFILIVLGKEWKYQARERAWGDWVRVVCGLTP